MYKPFAKSLASVISASLIVLGGAMVAPTVLAASNHNFALVHHAPLKPYSHYANAEDIDLVLNDFATQQGYVPSISPAIEGIISGRFDKIDGKTFMDAMRAAYGVGYYTAGNIMYFFHESEWTQTLLKPMSLTGQELINALKNGQLSSPQLPITLDSHGLLVIGGPAYYVDNIAKVARSLDATHNVQPIIKVFKLKYARADDITINSMNETITIPGVASLLQRMVSGQDTSGSGLSVVRHNTRQDGVLGKQSGVAIDGEQSGGSKSISEQLASFQSGSRSSSGSDKATQVNVIADGRLNAVIVQDAPSRMPYYAQVIAELDKQTNLVELHAAIVDVDADATESLGIDWGGSANTGNWNLGGAIGNAIDPTKALNPAGGGIFSTIFDTGNSRFMAQLNLLETQSKAKTLGRPSVITMDNIEATLEDTSTLYIPVSGYQASDLFKVDAGTILRVTPHIIEEQDGSRYIQMVIALQSNQNSEHGQVSTQVDSSGRVIVIPPTISQTKINTQAIVKEGQSLLIGGYYVESSSTTDSGLPSLKNAPGVGGLFGSNSEKANQRKRLLIITPKIIGLEELKNHQQVVQNQNQNFTTAVNDTSYNYVIQDPMVKSSGCASSNNKNASATPINSAAAPAAASGAAAPGAATGTMQQVAAPGTVPATTPGNAPVALPGVGSGVMPNQVNMNNPTLGTPIGMPSNGNQDALLPMPPVAAVRAKAAACTSASTSAGAGAAAGTGAGTSAGVGAEGLMCFKDDLGLFIQVLDTKDLGDVGALAIEVQV